MRVIATHVDDSTEQLRATLAAQRERPGYAIDPYFYRSHLVHELELEHLVFKSWIYALHTSEIPQVGDYQILEIGEDAIIVVRTEDGSIRAMHNSCRHRGSRVCEGPSGNRKTFVCPYHGWSYGLDGALLGIPHEDGFPDIDKLSHGLAEVTAIETKGMIFVIQESGADTAKAEEMLEAVPDILRPDQAACTTFAVVWAPDA